MVWPQKRHFGRAQIAGNAVVHNHSRHRDVF
jgi:hypothetical protein